MKRSFNFALMLVLFAAPAFAGSKHTTVDIPEKVQIGSAQVAAGQYELSGHPDAEPEGGCYVFRKDG
jgi:hypothetical protein